MKRVWLAIALALLSYALVDILIWQRIFEEEQRQTDVLMTVIPHYHAAWQIMLASLIAVGCVGFWREKLKMFFFATATVTLAFSGLEDVLYYWLDGRMIPDQLPWLNNSVLIIKMGMVTNDQLLISVCIWLIFWLLMTLLIEWVWRVDSK